MLGARFNLGRLGSPRFVLWQCTSRLVGTLLPSIDTRHRAVIWRFVLLKNMGIHPLFVFWNRVLKTIILGMALQGLLARLFMLCVVLAVAKKITVLW